MKEEKKKNEDKRRELRNLAYQTVLNGQDFAKRMGIISSEDYWKWRLPFDLDRYELSHEARITDMKEENKESWEEQKYEQQARENKAFEEGKTQALQEVREKVRALRIEYATKKKENGADSALFDLLTFLSDI